METANCKTESGVSSLRCRIERSIRIEAVGIWRMMFLNTVIHLNKKGTLGKVPLVWLGASNGVNYQVRRAGWVFYVLLVSKRDNELFTQRIFHDST